MSARRPITRPLVLLLPLDEPDDASAADPLDHLIAAEFGQLLRDEARRPPRFIHDLGMLMQVPAPFGYLRLHIG